MATRRAAASFAVVMLITSKICFFFSRGRRGGEVAFKIKFAAFVTTLCLGDYLFISEKYFMKLLEINGEALKRKSGQTQYMARPGAQLVIGG